MNSIPQSRTGSAPTLFVYLLSNPFPLFPLLCILEDYISQASLPAGFVYYIFCKKKK